MLLILLSPPLSQSHKRNVLHDDVCFYIYPSQANLSLGHLPSWRVGRPAPEAGGRASTRHLRRQAGANIFMTPVFFCVLHRRIAAFWRFHGSGGWLASVAGSGGSVPGTRLAPTAASDPTLCCRSHTWRSYWACTGCTAPTCSYCCQTRWQQSITCEWQSNHDVHLSLRYPGLLLLLLYALLRFSILFHACQ